MKPRLIKKLQAIRAGTNSKAFILADAKDADMTWGIPSPGRHWPAARGSQPRYRSMDEFCEQIREIVRQGIVDIMLTSMSTMSLLAHEEKLFDHSDVTPAIRSNDTTDIWTPRGGRYRQHPSYPFATPYIEESQYGSLTAKRSGKPPVNLGLFSITFNNDLHADREALQAFKEFRADAQRTGFDYFLEVFAPNRDAGLTPEQIPDFVNDHIARTLAGIPRAGWPVFLKVPYFNPRAMEELVNYDSSVVVGIMGGSAGTTGDSFTLVAAAQRYGARAALLGRRIKEAESPLAFISLLRQIVDGNIGPKEACKAYHAELKKMKIPSRRTLAADLISNVAQ